MSKKWSSQEELAALNKAWRIFEKYRIENSLFQIPLGEEYYATRKEQVYDIIREVVDIMSREHPLWNFGKFPHEN